MATCVPATTARTVVCSPYAPFRAAEWIPVPPARPQPPPRLQPTAPTWACWVQGELFNAATTGGG